MLLVLPFLLNSVLSFAIGLLVAKALGPDAYGRFALALSIAVVIQTFGFEWLRLAALRFYSESDREKHPEIRATLDLGLGLALAAASGAAGFILLAGVNLPPSPKLAALAIGAAAANAAFDFVAALARARFLDRAYGRLVIAKNVLALLLTVGGAFAFQSAEMALVGLILSAAGSIALALKTLIDPLAHPRHAQKALFARYAAYGAPIVLANALYQIVPMLNRSMAADQLSFAESGQLALAFETGVRVIGALGSSLDVILFQLAVRTEKTHGADDAKAQIGRNFAIVLAILAPAITGIVAIMPSFEALLAPKSFQGPFGLLFIAQAPALLTFGLMNYAVYPAFQIEKRTGPLIACALVALIANLGALQYLPAQGVMKFAQAQTISSLGGFIALLIAMAVYAPYGPRWRDIGAVALGSAVMAAAIWPLRAMTPGLIALAAQIVVGGVVYAAIAWALNSANLRNLVRARFKKGE
jgi:O-antigen/teichoic acid export membrane protein